MIGSDSALGAVVNALLPAELSRIIATAFGNGAALGHTITIRRANSTLNPQEVRIASVSGFSVMESNGAEASQAIYWIMGATDLDIQTRDRFNVDGQLYEVTAVRPHKQVATYAQARVVQ